MMYKTAAGDMVDAICVDYYKKVPMDDAINAVLEANPGLSEYGPVLPGNLKITLPVIAPKAPAPGIQLWQ